MFGTKINYFRDVWARAEGLAYICIVVFIYGCVNWMYLWNFWSGLHDRSVIKTAAQALILGIGCAALMFGPLSTKGSLKWILLTAFAFSTSANFVSFSIMHVVPKRPIGVWLYSEIEQSRNAAMEWTAIVVLMSLYATVAFGALAILGSRIRQLAIVWLGQRWAWRLRAGATFVALGIPMIGGISQANMGLAESSAYAYGIVALRLETPKPAIVSSLPENEPAADKIVLVVDESIRPDAFTKKVLPLLSSTPDISTYENAFSIANCSAASNGLMRWGVDPRYIGMRHDPRQNASLWAYAKRAGFSTTLIDAQVKNSGDRQDLLNHYEIELIDNHVGMDVGIDSDVKVAEELSRRLLRPGKEFIYIVKRGSHVPYASNLPKGFVQKTMTASEIYEEAVAYSTGRFFSKLRELSPSLNGAVLFYVSDHGQWFGGTPAHCSGMYLDDEYKIPMMIWSNGEFSRRLRISKDCWKDGVSQQNLRTSTIIAMGYSEKELGGSVFPALSECPLDKRIPRYIGQLPILSGADDILKFVMIPALDKSGKMDARPQ